MYEYHLLQGGEEPVYRKPDYYKHPSGIECKDISKYLSAALAQAFQYVWRAGNKPNNDMIVDLNKALDWIDIESTIEPRHAAMVENTPVNALALSQVLAHESGNKAQALSCIFYANILNRDENLAAAKAAVQKMIDKVI